MKIIICLGALLAGMLFSLSGEAQVLDEPLATPGPRTAASSAPPCFRAHCGNLTAPANQQAVNFTPAVLPKANWQRSEEGAWKEHMANREQREDYNCLLSVGFGAALQAHGYQGFRILGQTRTLSLAGGKAEK